MRVLRKFFDKLLNHHLVWNDMPTMPVYDCWMGDADIEHWNGILYLRDLQQAVFECFVNMPFEERHWAAKDALAALDAAISELWCEETC